MKTLRHVLKNERRQIVTFGFAVSVFLMTLFAQYLHDRGSTLRRIAIAGARNGEVSRAQIALDRSMALATIPGVEVR
ncbi:MAG: hypothetical protein HY269_07530 [Deltaproteobacteria bacterium]|nr:hypothetical protein [Deltaproteobacteria bacterium]